MYAAPFDALAYNGMQINGSMDVSQELGTTGTSTSNAYALDGWLISYSSGMVITAAQFTWGRRGGNSEIRLELLSATAKVSLVAGDTVGLQHRIEGYRIARLGFGTAKRSRSHWGFGQHIHRTGIYSCGIRNGGGTRSYVTTYTQNVSDTYEYKTVTIPGDTTGTWLSTNGIGFIVDFAMASGATMTVPAANVWTSGNYNAAPGQV